VLQNEILDNANSTFVDLDSHRCSGWRGLWVLMESQYSSMENRPGITPVLPV